MINNIVSVPLIICDHYQIKININIKLKLLKLLILGN